MTRPYSIPDDRHRLRLDDDWDAAWCINVDGTSWPWLMRAGGDDLPHGCDCQTCAPHDQRGPCPVDLDRCGAPTQTGTPCMRPVKEPGRCWQHADPRRQRAIKRLADTRARGARRRLTDRLDRPTDPT